MAANSNVYARFNIQASFGYQSGTSTANFPSSLGPGQISLLVTGSGSGVSTKAYAMISFPIPAATTFTLDLASFVDGLNAATSWVDLKYFSIQHDAASAATGGIDFPATAANAIPSLRGSLLLPGQSCVPFFSSTTGFAFTAPNSRIVIANLDPANTATVSIIMMGE